MTITLNDATRLNEAAVRPERLAFKNAEGEAQPGQMLAVDEAQGIITAIVSVTGTEDEVADIIVPGAYKSTLLRRRPKVCWAHSWERPVGKVLHIEELLPGDDRLPSKTLDGSPWPTEAGALVATMQFNMKSEAGKEAFAAAEFFSRSGECFWSIGYQVPPGKSSKDRHGVRHIKALELYEVSIVLFGAHPLTGTIDVKTLSIADAYAAVQTGGRTAAEALAALTEGKAKAPPFVKKPAEDEAPAGTEKPAPPKPPAAPKAPDDDADKGVPDFSDGVMVAVYPDAAAADAVANHISGPDDTLPRDELHVTLAYLGKTSEVTMSADEIIEAVEGAVEGMSILDGYIAGIGMFPESPDSDTGAPTWAPVDVVGLGLLREEIVEALGDNVSDDHGFTPHMTLGYGMGMIEPVPETPVTFSTVRVVFGNQRHDISLGQAVPTEERKSADVEWADGEAPPQGVYDALPEAEYTRPAAEEKAGGADRNRGNAEKLRAYWTTGEGGAKIAWGTPGDFTRCVELLDEHMPGRAEGYCANRHKEMTGMWPGDKDNKAAAYDPLLENVDLTGITSKGTPMDSATPAGVKDYPYLSGTFEERLTRVRAAASEAMRGDLLDEAENRYEWNYIDVRATWPEGEDGWGRLIATRHKWGPTEESEDWEIPYRCTDDGTIELGEPEQTTLQIMVVGLDGETTDEEVPLADAMPLADDLWSIVAAVKASRPTTIEGKAGRVLSGRNERRIRAATEELLSVLAAAGIEIRDPEDPERDVEFPDTTGDRRRDMDPRVDPETTSQTAARGAKALTLDDIAADLADLGIEV